MISLYDSEVLEVEKILTVLNLRKGRATNLDAFVQEAKDRFHKVGLVVNVLAYSTNVQGTTAFDIEIIGRTDSRHEFDHDRMVHEVTNDILDLGAKGVIKSTKEDARRALETERKHRKCARSSHDSCNH